MASTALVPKSKKKTQPEQETATEAVDTTSSKELVAKTDELLNEIDDMLAETIERFNAEFEELEEDKPYTLADAMREGSSVTNQAIGQWTGAQGETCALSAAYLAVKARGLAGLDFC